jgi:glycosyltransferase involved in cell wall biosynthesis
VPVVSIFCITYNHGKFIRDAIEGFLMQETTFPVQIFIHDDASTDGTAQIVKEYAAKFPRLFWTVLQTENQWSKGSRKFFFDYLAQQCGEFIALCEGDDYWTSPCKLQSQVALLETDLQAVGVFHAVTIADEDGMFLGRMPSEEGGGTLAFEDIVALNDRATCSMLFRYQSPAPDLAWAKDLPMGDWPLQAALAAHGPWFLMNEVMGTYRKHRTSVWSSGGDERAMRGALSFYDAAIKEFGLRAHEAVSGRRKDLLAVLLYCALRRGDWAEARSCLATLSWQDRLTTIAYSGIRAVTRCLKRYGQATSPVSAPQFRTG